MLLSILVHFLQEISLKDLNLIVDSLLILLVVLLCMVELNF